MALSKSAQGLAGWCEAERGRAARLAEHLGVSRTTINHYCRGVITPGEERWEPIAQFTGGEAPSDGWRAATSDDERPTPLLPTGTEG